MARNGSGTYSLPAGNPVVTGTPISSTTHNTTMTDIANAITQSIAYDGQTVPVANLPMGGFKLTGLGAATTNGDAVRYEQLANPTIIASINTHQIGGMVNYLINAGAEVAQGSTASLSTAAQYGQVDMCTMWASGGAVSAGTITQNTSATVGRTGKAVRAAGVTLTGAGVISWRYRVESIDAAKLKNKTVSFQIAVMHDVGSSINYTIIIRKPTAVDNYTSTTVINTGSATAVATGTATVLTTPAGGISLGDCSNGLEIEVQAACGAITTKNFDFTEWQLEEGGVVTPVERRLVEIEVASCQRYYYSVTGIQLYLLMSTAVSTFRNAYQQHPVPMRTGAPSANVISATGGTVTVLSANQFGIAFSANPGNTTAELYISAYSVSARL